MDAISSSTSAGQRVPRRLPAQAISHTLNAPSLTSDEPPAREASNQPCQTVLVTDTLHNPSQTEVDRANREQRSDCQGVMLGHPPLNEETGQSKHERKLLQSHGFGCVAK